jgi:Ca2+-binding EF-hand superfamily protein
MTMNDRGFKNLTIGMTAMCGLALSSYAIANEKGTHTGMVGSEMKMMDTDNDGKITRDEHNSGARKMFEMMDSNKDGKVTATEMDAAREQMMGKKSDRAGDKMADKTGKAMMSSQDKIKMIDTNNDGAISAEEHTQGARTMFDRMDTDRDGSLTATEIAAGHAKMMGKSNPK